MQRSSTPGIAGREKGVSIFSVFGEEKNYNKKKVSTHPPSTSWSVNYLPGKTRPDGGI